MAIPVPYLKPWETHEDKNQNIQYVDMCKDMRFFCPEIF